MFVLVSVVVTVTWASTFTIQKRHESKMTVKDVTTNDGDLLLLFIITIKLTRGRVERRLHRMILRTRLKIFSRTKLALRTLFTREEKIHDPANAVVCGYFLLFGISRRRLPTFLYILGRYSSRPPRVSVSSARAGRLAHCYTSSL